MNPEGGFRTAMNEIYKLKTCKYVGTNIGLKRPTKLFTYSKSKAERGIAQGSAEGFFPPPPSSRSSAPPPSSSRRVGNLAGSPNLAWCNALKLGCSSGMAKTSK